MSEYRAITITQGSGGFGGPLTVEPKEGKDVLLYITGGGAEPDILPKIVELTGCRPVNGFKTSVPEEEIFLVIIDCGGTLRCGIYPQKRIPTININPVGKSGPMAKYITEDIYVSGVKNDNIALADGSAAPISEAAPAKEEKIRKTAIIYSPVDGIAADLSTAPDEGFAGKMMGDGAVVTPTEGTVYAPADGEVEFIFDTKHAIGFQTDSGIPMLLHMGIDTVKLEGKGFEILVTEGQKVKKGDPMMKLDLEFLTANAPSITSPILDTEPEDNQRIRLLANGEIKAGEPLFAVETLE